MPYNCVLIGKLFILSKPRYLFIIGKSMESKLTITSYFSDVEIPTEEMNKHR